ncbi:MAG: bifunctional (p)ppGpp synthetase/guanosine-3',5'-bis(diphosphate) 3'-pyrophosphohydrolase [Anaerolineae bacterium]|nr:bifunctional (p)ppGpp synthetase/guanosine-3',5'-bis(diphosphate) 3'-pyrophosphohydrolase [Anaerolineae bacterium]
MISFEELIRPLASQLAAHEMAILQKAYDFAREAHKGQKRKSGEDFFVHCIEVARILVDLRMDVPVIAAGLLHDVVEDTAITLEDLNREFGAEIRRLVDGVTKLDQVPLNTDSTSRGRDRDREAEYLRKTLLAMDDDVRVILIKLADRLHNMRTLGHLSPERQRRMAQETTEIFAPLASRLGIWQMKWELQDLSFRYLDPDGYKRIASLITDRRADRDRYMTHLVERLKQLLEQNGITGADVSGRSKHIYSIWRKMEQKELTFDQIYDVRAVRVIVPTIGLCYQVLGLIHQTWRPITGEFDDYIAAPKDNFYQSLHTAVILEDKKTLEVQIRTPEMHVAAEYGVAAHWRYKEIGSTTRGRDEAYERRLKYLRDMMEVGREVEDANEFLDTMRSDVFQDRVYVFTPRGDIVDLPAGSTPIDFAYHIHTDIGNRCRGAKANGKLVPLDYTLQVGDRMEILTSKRGGPSRDWLNPNLGYVRTKRALAKIRHWFRRQDREKMIALGREMLDRELKRLGLEKMKYEQAAALFEIDNADDFLAQIGFGDIHPHQLVVKMAEEEVSRSDEDDLLKLVSTVPDKPRPTTSGEIQIQGTGGLLTNLARCCNPVQGDEIIGYITQGRGVTIHRKDCRNILTLPTQRLISVDWGTTDQENRYAVPIMINAYDREGLLRDIGIAVADEHINIRSVTVNTHNHIAVFNVTLEVESATQLSRVLSKIEQLPNIMEARRMTG